jgi:hypothetical protein
MSTKPEFLAAELEAGAFGPSMVQNEQALRIKAAAELRRLASVEAERDQLRAEVEALRGLKPEIPHRPTHNNDASFQHPSLPRYGLRWNGPGQPVSVPMEDGYWTPFHLALEELEVHQADAERYRDIRDGNAGEYAIREWIEGEDGEGFYQDVRAPEVVDAAVDEARKG